MKTILLILLVCSFCTRLANSQWQQVFYNEPPQLFANENHIFAGTGISGLHISSNNGNNWFQTSFTQGIIAYAANSTLIFSGTNFGVFKSSNNGLNWSQTSLSNPTLSLLLSGNYIIAGVQYGIYVSTNNGTNWNRTFMDNYEVFCLLEAGGNIFAGMGSQHGVYRSTNNGLNWTQTSLNIRTPYSLAAIGSNIFAGMAVYGVYKSSNNGLNWVQTSFNNQTVNELIVHGNNIIAATSQGVYISTDLGNTWIQRNEGIGTPIIYSVCISNNYIFAGGTVGGNHGAFRRPLSELVGVKQISSEIPNTFSLSQNYPNPFNPATNIKFSVSKSSLVKLAVFDVSGRELETLVNQNMPAGTYKADWNASKYSSGVYFYTITSESYIETKKMILIK